VTAVYFHKDEMWRILTNIIESSNCRWTGKCRCSWVGIKFFPMLSMIITKDKAYENVSGKKDR
jgi:hypothetical protein